MADLEEIVKKLEEKYEQHEKKIQEIELNTTKYFGEIKTSLAEIKGLVARDKEVGNKDNDMIIEKVKNNSERITKIESIISKIVWIIIAEVLGAGGAAITYFIQHKP